MKVCVDCDGRFSPRKESEVRCTLCRSKKRSRDLHQQSRMATRKACPTCGNEFIPQKTTAQIFCSVECRDSKNRPHSQPAYTRICEGCGGEFVPKKGDRVRFCSRKCYFQWASRKPPYEARGLNRRTIFRRDGWKCRACGRATPSNLVGTHAPNAPELDHIIPISKGGTHSSENVQLLCRECNHRKADKIEAQPCKVENEKAISFTSFREQRDHPGQIPTRPSRQMSLLDLLPGSQSEGVKSSAR